MTTKTELLREAFNHASYMATIRRADFEVWKSCENWRGKGQLEYRAYLWERIAKRALRKLAESVNS